MLLQQKVPDTTVELNKFPGTLNEFFNYEYIYLPVWVFCSESVWCYFFLPTVLITYR